MPINIQKLHKHSRIAVGVGAAVLLVLGLILILQGFIDTRDYRTQVIESIKAQTGREPVINGKVSVSLLPRPTLYIPKIELHGAEGEKPIPAVTVEMVRIRVPLSSLFSGHPKISNIALDRPSIELVRDNDNQIYWDWLNVGLLKLLAVNNASEGQASLEINDGKVAYHDNNSDKNIVVQNITAIINSSGSQGAFRLYGHNLNFSLHKIENVQNAPSNATAFNLALYGDEHSAMEFKGSLDFTGDLPDIKGTLNADFTDVLTWTKSNNAEEKTVSGTNPLTKAANKKITFPLKITTEWAQHGLDIDMSNVKLDGLGSAGSGTVKLSWKNDRPAIASNMIFSTLKFDEWKTFVTHVFVGEDADSAIYNGSTQVDNPLPKDYDLSLNVAADQFLYAGQPWKNAKLSADLADGAATVNQLIVDLPGGSTLNLFGIVSQAPTGSLRFEGNMETHGKSLRDMLTAFDESAADLPETGFGDFSARSNIFISSEQLRLSEADVKLSDLHLNGGLADYFDTNPRIEANVRLKEINFDYFRDVWRSKQKKDDTQNGFLTFDKSINFSWLKKLQTSIDFKVDVQQFTFLERQGSSASFRIFAKQGEFGIYDMAFVYPTDVMTGNFKLDVNGEQPAINLTLAGGEINSSYFNAQAETAKPEDIKQMVPVVPLPKNAAFPVIKDMVPLPALPDMGVIPPKPAQNVEDLQAQKPQGLKKEDVTSNPRKWPEELIDMSWLEGFSGNVDLGLNKFTYKNIVLNNLKLQAAFQQDLMTFKTFTFNYWGGQCSILGSLYGGKVPGISISATVANADLNEILQQLADRNNISGKVSISTVINTSGVNLLSWISQSEAKIALSGRGVNVNGINVQGVVDAVSVSRTSADVFNSVNAALVNGSTSFSMDGNINVKNGILKTPGINLNTETVQGILSGELKLIPWTMELSTQFQFPALSSETVPTMTVQLTGPVAAGELRTDTSSLEAYVAKRITGK